VGGLAASGKTSVKILTVDNSGRLSQPKPPSLPLPPLVDGNLTKPQWNLGAAVDRPAVRRASPNGV